MTINSSGKFNQLAFRKMKQIMPNLLAAQREQTNHQHYQLKSLPSEIAFKLTNRCNLRCKHCYQWNEEGHHHDLDKEEQNRDIDFSIIEKVFAQTREVKSNVYLWGGEPLIYRDWDKFVDLLAADPRFTSMCTNGIWIKKRLDSILRVSEVWEILVALEGFPEEHDAIRGKGNHKKAMEGLDLLLQEKAAGNYKGEVTVNFVVTNSMVGKIYEMIEFLEAKQLDTVYLSLPWFLSDQTSAKMDQYYTKNFDWLCSEHETQRPSWHAYKYSLSSDAVEQLMEQLDKVNQRDWQIKVRYNPEVNPDEVKDFILGSDKPAQNKTQCLSIKSRMDVFPNGEVISCKFFPEMLAGNLKQESVGEIWQGCQFSKIRETIDTEGLMPVCAKCNLLYSRGI